MLVRSLLLISLAAFTTAEASDLTKAEEIVNERCHHCHGKEGEASSSIYPRLAGQNANYIAKQLADFKSGKRQGTMNEMAADLEDDEMLLLGEYFASKAPLAHRARDKELTAVGQYIFNRGNKYSGVASCASCHGKDGAGTDQLPRLAGQHKRYLISQLQEFNRRERTNDNAIMHSIASKLTELEVEAVSRYISAMK